MADVLFTNVRIFDGSGDMPYTGELLVQGNRIARVVKTGYGQRAAPVMGAQTIDGAGAFLMPGMRKAPAPSMTCAPSTGGGRTP